MIESFQLSSFIRTLYTPALLVVIASASGCLPTTQVKSVADTASEEDLAQEEEMESTEKQTMKESQAIMAEKVIASAPTAPIVLGYFTNWSTHGKALAPSQRSK